MVWGYRKYGKVPVQLFFSLLPFSYFPKLYPPIPTFLYSYSSRISVEYFSVI